MKKSTLIAVLFSAMFFFGFHQVGWGQTLLLDENFSYTSGTLLSANGWTAHSGAGTNSVTVVSPLPVTYPGYSSSGIGNEVSLTTTGEDVNIGYTSTTTGSIYASVLVNVTSAGLTGDYFFHLSPTSGATTGAFSGRVFVKRDASNNLAFGVSKGSTSTISYSTFTYSLNTTYLIVLKYTFNSGSTTDDVASLFINPTLNSSEPLPLLTSTDASTDAAALAAVELRQGTAANAPALKLDGIRVATTWADIVGPIVPTIISAPTSLTGFSYAGSGPSSEQSFTVSGVNLTNDITITPPADYEISTGTGGAFVATNPVTLAQTAGTVASTTIYTRLKAGLAAGNYNAEDISITSAGATSKTVSCSGSVLQQIDWANLQWPFSGTITFGGGYTVYARVYEPGVTDAAGQGAGITCWIGYSTTNTDPSTWTDWVPATYNAGYVDPGNDEYMADLGVAIPATGTYYYASRFQLGTAPYVYGGLDGGFWNGTTNYSGTLTVNAAPQIDWANLQWPASGTINSGDIYNVYAQVYEPGITDAGGQGAGISAWIGFSTTNTNPNTWPLWSVCSYNNDNGNNDEYFFNLGGVLTSPGTYYYASRFQLGTYPYVYGGYNSGFWDGTTNVSGVLYITPSWTTGWPKAEDALSTGFTAKVNINATGTAYYVVLPSGATAPTSAQVKAGQDATGTSVAANLQGSISCATAATEYTSNVTGLSTATTYDVYFVAEESTLVLQLAPVMRTVSTSAAPTAPIITTPTATGIGSGSATLGGDITADGGAAITARGTVWNTVTGVAITDNPLAEGGTTTGIFTHPRTSLPSGVQVFYKAYATNSAGTALSDEASFYTLSTEPTSHVTGFTAVANGTTGIDLSWLTASTGAYGYMILQKTGSSAPTGLPADATSYSVGSVIGDGNVAAIVTPGTALAASITGLNIGTQYSFTIIPFNYSGFATATFNFYTDAPIPSATASTDYPPSTTYTWIGADNAAWTDAANWNPVRTTPATTDILLFNDGTTKSVTAVPTETIGQLLVSNNTVVNLQSAAAAIVTITGSAGNDLVVATGCALNLNAINAITITVATGATGSISGTMTYSATANTGHRLFAADASAITFNSGSSITVGPFCTGNIFGTTNLNSIVFSSGSTYIAKSGSNPFGAGQPNSVVVFQTGSLYLINANLTPSLSGRTYGNMEVDFPTATLNTSGTAAVSIDNLTITNGTLNFNMTATPGHSIKGNITVAAGGALNFAPTAAGTVNLNGTGAQTISNSGTLTFGANSTINVNNTNGVILSSPVAFNNLSLTDGIVTTGANTLTVNSALTGGSATAYVDGKLALPFAAASSKTFPIGKGGNYRPVTLAYTALDAPSTVTAEQTESALTGTLPAGATLFADRFWTLTQTGATVFAYDITLDGTGFLPAATPVILKNDAGTVTWNATTGTPPAYTASGLSSFSGFALASYVPPPVITSSPATLTGFGYIQGSGPSGEQTFTVSGVNLTSNISIAATTNYEISTTPGAGYTTPITLAHIGGTVASTTIYVRLKAGLTAGAYNGEVINITATGATTNTVTCSGTVINPVLSTGTLTGFGNVCINTTAGPSSFTISGTDLTTSDVTVAALAGFTYSTTAAGTYTATLSIPQTGGVFSATVYVKFTPTLVQSYNGNIAVGGGGAPSVNVAASGSGVNTPATVTTSSPATAITGISATAGGDVTDAGCGTITARGICYGTATNPDITGTKTTETGTTGAFSSNITGLTPATTYYYRAYVTSSVTTSYGTEFTFTTLAVAPTVVTDAATAISGTGATLNGTVNANNSSTAATFEYGLTIAYGSTVTATPATVTGTSGTSVAYILSGLTPNTTYHFRAIGVNVGGTTNGSDLTFTTSTILPTVVTDAATLITATSATLNGTVNANNASTAVTFEYGTTIAYGNVVTATPATVTGVTGTTVSYALSGLEPNTTYHFRAVGVNAAGTQNGSDLTFVTTALAPTVVTTAATGIGASSATLNGNVNANNQTATVTFEYGLTAAYGSVVNATPNTVNGYTATPVSAPLTGLALSQTYHYRVVAVNATGTSYGDDLTFFTNCLLPDPAGTIAGNAAVCQTSAGVVYTVGAINLATNYVWTVPAGATIVSGNGTNSIVVDFDATAVSGNITVYGSSACGDGTPSSLAVTVSARPLPVISGSAIACIGGTDHVYTTAAGMTAYNWTVSAGGTITAGTGTNAITVTWTTLGAKTVTVNYANAGGCTALVAGTFSVNVNAVPSPTIAGVSEVCAGATDVVYTTEAGFNAYEWTISYGGTITSGLNTNEVSVTWATAGSRTISVNYNNALGCNANAPTDYDVTVLSVPVPVIAGETEVCEGATGIAYTTQPNYDDYLWTVSAGGVITSGAGTNAIAVSWTGNGNQTVSVSYTNDLGCGSIEPTVYNVTVTPKPAAAGAITGTASVCAGALNVAYSVPEIAGAVSYNWTLPSAGAVIVTGEGTNSITVNYGLNATSGIMKVSGVNDCGIGAGSPNYNVTVNPIPATPVITQQGDTLTSSAVAGNQWYLDGVEIPGATGQQHVCVYTGTYTVVVTLNGCSSAPSNGILVLPVGTKDLSLSSKLSIYPNPSKGEFDIKVENGKSEEYTIEIFNNLGASVWKQENVTINGIYTNHIDLNNPPAGVYMVSLRNKTNSLVKKVVIMK